MKHIRTFIILIALAVAPAACAQYWQLANQLTDMIGTVFAGGTNYKGTVEISALKGIGENNGDFVGISTSQGATIGRHFFMGVGLGVDAIFAHVDDSSWAPGPPPALDRDVTKKGCIMPLFTDFRAAIGTPGKPQCLIGLKIGCSFLLSDSYISVNRGYITSNECFYLQPSVGVRIPVSKVSPNLAANISLAYRLITPGYQPYYASASQAITLNSFGLTLGFEW